jgi:esterase/lipase superfamily enzyme/predicted acylesterase/phospholipase RssA
LPGFQITSAPPKKIGICLSGGGFRATFFHLGLIRFLRRHDLLRQVTHISSVSGGSVLAAHLVLNWQRYLDPKDFNQAEEELIRFGQRDVRGRIVRRWLLAIVFPLLRLFPRISHRTYLLEREYASFLKRALLRDIEPHDQDRPVLHLLATSFTTGKLCSFSGEGFWTHDESATVLHRTGLMPLALAVASSSAFPPFFPPTAITRRMLDASYEELPYDLEFLTDGGVFDNLGFAKFLELFQSGDCQIDYLILSDAGAQLDWDIKGRFARVISRTIRSTDILMQRVAEFTVSDLASKSVGAETFHLSISSQVLESHPRRTLLIDFQKKLPRIRTDLNRFSALEIDFLAKHGEEVARDRLKFLIDPSKEANETTLESRPYEINNVSMPKAARLLDNSRLRTIGLFNRRDWMSFVLYGYLLAILTLAILPYLYVVQRAVQGDLFARTVQVSFATDRKPESLTQFGEEIEDRLYTGLATVKVPPVHRKGLLERPGGGFFDFSSDDKKYFNLSSVYTSTGLTIPFSDTAANGMFIYIHGYNTSFEYALMKTAQLALDTEFEGAAIGYGWGSHAKASAYQQDQAAANSSIPHFAEYIATLKRAQLGAINIVAEGMGAAILLNGIKRLLDANPALVAQESRKPFGQLVFFIPDVESTRFTNLLKFPASVAERVTVFVAPNSDLMREAKEANPSARAGSETTFFATISNADTVLLTDYVGQQSEVVAAAIGAIMRRQPMPWNASLTRRDDKIWVLPTE